MPRMALCTFWAVNLPLQAADLELDAVPMLVMDEGSRKLIEAR